ncbi:thioredoxin reductase (NADPH) [Nematocida displodere]|uniref:Thioredoxin reductase (NADPH) n=1 Tax=Nematocida displodere TaxID=1805483 RepID=A0A177EC07_9MICR|nr:thioredoxin reductase (NADPH) [Nematocida displodere]
MSIVNIEDVIIVGSGPAAYSAALYLKKHRPLVLAGDWYSSTQNPGGQLTTTLDVDNYPGFPKGVNGGVLADMFKDHAASEETRVLELWVASIKKEEEYFMLQTTQGTYRARSVVIATGSVARRLFVKGTREGEFWQKGISACATCDGWQFKGKVVMVVGGGDTAMEESLYLADTAKHVFLINRTDKFRARPDLLERVKSHPNITIETWRTLHEATGDEILKGAVLNNEQTNQKTCMEIDGLFFAIGHTPSTAFLKELEINLDNNGYIETKKETMETNIPGVFAAGDVQDFRYRQAITAAYTGMLAGVSASAYLGGNNK